MRKILLSLLMMVAFVFTANAAEVVFDLTEGYQNAEAVTSVSSDGITLTFDKGSNSNEPKWYSTGTALRIYGGSTLTVTSTVGSVQSVIFTFNGNYTFNSTDISTVTDGTYSESGATGTWILNSTTATITRGGTSGHARIQAVTVTVSDDGSLASPLFSVAAGTYYMPKTVEITNPNSTGTVYYTTNGDDPTAESAEYTEPIEVSTTTTLKAIVVDGDKTSEITEATYTIEEPYEVISIAEYLQQADNTVVKFNNSVIAVYQNGSYLYVQDRSGVALIYGSVGQTYTNGDVIPDGFIGTKTTYNDLVELNAAAGAGSYQASTDNIGAVNPIVGALSDITANDVNKYYVFYGVTYDATNKKLIDADGSELVVYNRFSGVSLPAAGEYDVYGFVSIYNGTIQLYPTDFVSKLTVSSIAEFKALETGSEAKFTNPVIVAQVVKGSKSTTVYAVDETGGIMLYGTNDMFPCDYAPNDIIPAGFTGSYTLYNGNPEVINITGLAAATETADNLPAQKLSTEDLATDMGCDVVKISGAEIKDIDGNNFVVTDESGVEIAAYNKFGLEIKAYSGIEIIAIVNIYSENLQLMPISIDYSEGTADELASEINTEIQITSGDGEIIVDGATDVEVYDSDGRHRATTVKGSGDTPVKRQTISVEAGVYIVVADGEVVAKVVAQ
ncbi:MAG: chitobiase/beta-hexosaminidase C-terminal domain-containing protein [Muribaculaceae bacterium]